MRPQTRPYIKTLRYFIALAIAVSVFACGGPTLEVNPKDFAESWMTIETEHFRFLAPEDSPRPTRVVLSFGGVCEKIYGQVIYHLEIEIKDPIFVYQFTTNQDCEETIGHPAGFVEASNVYTRIGAEMGGALAEAMCNAIDPDAESFPLIRDGLRAVFDERHSNVHLKAQELLQEAGRWYRLPELIAGSAKDDNEAYRFATASFVAYLIQVHGSDKFKMLWRSVLELGPSLEKIYGLTLDQLETEWMEHMGREARET
jgi:hypothetical protein